jgi:hypothetical protein
MEVVGVGQGHQGIPAASDDLHRSKDRGKDLAEALELFGIATHVAGGPREAVTEELGSAFGVAEAGQVDREEVGCPGKPWPDPLKGQQALRPGTGQYEAGAGGAVAFSKADLHPLHSPKTNPHITAAHCCSAHDAPALWTKTRIEVRNAADTTRTCCSLGPVLGLGSAM